VSGKSEELERLAIERYAPGLSMRDIEAAPTDARGRCVLSRSSASMAAYRQSLTSRERTLVSSQADS
jgi:hypothetical protein